MKLSWAARAKSRQRMEGNWEPQLGPLVQTEGKAKVRATQPVSSLHPEPGLLWSVFLMWQLRMDSSSQGLSVPGNRGASARLAPSVLQKPSPFHCPVGVVARALAEATTLCRKEPGKLGVPALPVAGRGLNRVEMAGTAGLTHTAGS